MAILISKKRWELYEYSCGTTCKNVFVRLGPNYSDDDDIDILTYCEWCRGNGLAEDANYGLYRELNYNQQLQFLIWGMSEIISHIPAGYSKTLEMAQLNSDISDCLTSPSTDKKLQLFISAKSIKPDASQNTDLYIANTFKGIAMCAAKDWISGELCNQVGTAIRRIKYLFSSIPQDTTSGELLTKLEQIIGVID